MELLSLLSSNEVTFVTRVGDASYYRYNNKCLLVTNDKFIDNLDIACIPKVQNTKSILRNAKETKLFLEKKKEILDKKDKNIPTSRLASFLKGSDKINSFMDDQQKIMERRREAQNRYVQLDDIIDDEKIIEEVVIA